MLNTRIYRNFSINLLKKRFQRMKQYSTNVQEKKIQVKGQTINYMQTGNGDHKVFCLPGAMGTIWTDFKPQIEGLDKAKFTILAWDPPGYGYSRPPDRNFSIGFCRNDAVTAYEFVKEIGINKFSILGWSNGGIAGMILAAEHPDIVNKLVVWGSNSHIIEGEVDTYEMIRDVSNWSEQMRAPLVKLYGADGLQNMWNSWCDAQVEIFKQGGNICKEYLEKIRCPTFIIHGDKDLAVRLEHAEFLLKHIKGSKLHRFPEGKHNVHKRYSDEFNAMVTKFLLE